MTPTRQNDLHDRTWLFLRRLAHRHRLEFQLAMDMDDMRVAEAANRALGWVLARMRVEFKMRGGS